MAFTREFLYKKSEAIEQALRLTTGTNFRIEEPAQKISSRL
jgi:hypothetical protein